VKGKHKKMEVDLKSIILDAVGGSGTQSKQPRLSHKKKINITQKPVDIAGDGIQYVDFNQKVKTPLKTKENLIDWNNRDFAIYIKEKNEAKFGAYWDLNFVGVVTYVNRIKEKILSLFGFCDNLVFRDYIDFYFERWASYYREKNRDKIAYLKPMLHDHIVASFIDGYDYNRRIKETSFGKKKEIPLTNEQFVGKLKENLYKSYLLGLNSFLLEYGFVVPVNWLIVEKKMEYKKAIDCISVVLDKVNRSSIFNKIVESTNNYSPYPEWFPFKNIYELNKNKDISKWFDKVSILFSEQSSWDIIKEKNSS
jgi:hypothetical protein